MTLKINGATGGSVSLDAPDNTSPAGTDVTLTLPTSAGSSGQVLTTDGSGTLSFTTLASDAITEGNTSVEVVDTGSDGQVRFTTEGTRAMTIDSSQRVLINTQTAPNGSTTQYPSLSVVGNSAGGANYGAMNLCRSEASANITQDEPIGQINFGDSGAGHYAHIKCSCDGNAGTDDYPGRLQFYTTRNAASAPTERMVITRDGTHRMYSATNFDTLELRYQGSSDTGNDIQQFYRDASMTTGVLVCKVRSDGNLYNTNGTYGTLSDSKLKENIVDANSQWDDIKALQIRNYNFKEETGLETHTQIGVIAQELELVSPRLVTQSPDRDEDGNDLGTTTKYVNLSVLYMKSVKALQEAMTRIEALETANASQAATIAALDARLTALEGGAA